MNATKVCYHCHQPKERYNSNGYCSDCDRQRYRERYAAIRKANEDYITRHLQRREQEAAIASTYERVEREASPKHYLDVVCLNEPKTVFGDQIYSLLRRPRRYFKWRIS